MVLQAIYDPEVNSKCSCTLCKCLCTHGKVGLIMRCGQAYCWCIHSSWGSRKRLCHWRTETWSKVNGVVFSCFKGPALIIQMLHLREFWWIPATPLDGLLTPFHFVYEQIHFLSRTTATWWLHLAFTWLILTHCMCVCVCFHVCPGLPAGASRNNPGHLGSFNGRAWQGATVQMAICLPEIPHGQLLPHHALPLQRVLCQHRSAAGL